MRWAMFVVLGITAADPGDSLPPDDAVNPVPVFRVEGTSSGIAIDHDGRLYLSDQNVIRRLTPQGSVDVWARMSAPGGHAILADDTHLVGDAKSHSVLHLDAAGRLLPAASNRSEGTPLRAPSDLVLDPRGGFYFSDPGGSDATNRIGTLHYVDPQGVTHVIAGRLAYPTGLALRPGGNELLVAESQYNRILVYPVLRTGRLGLPRVLIDLPRSKPGQPGSQPRGLALDVPGNLFIAQSGTGEVQVVSPKGVLIRRYRSGHSTATGLAFGGPWMDRLYVSGGSPGGLSMLVLPGVQGLTVIPARAIPSATSPADERARRPARPIRPEGVGRGPRR